MAKKQTKQKTERETPDWEQGLWLVRRGPLGCFARVFCDRSYPIGKNDWAYVTSKGEIRLNPQRKASPKEWEYVIAHCLLHLGFGHFREHSDLLWNTACDWVVTKFLRDSHIGSPPQEFCREFPFAVKNEEQVYEQLLEQPELCAERGFSLTDGRPDMVWCGPPEEDYTQLLAQRLQESIHDAIEKAGYGYDFASRRRSRTVYHKARDWFISGYPLLGAVASAFRIVDDKDGSLRANVPIAAVSPALREIYVNPRARLDPEEWKFVLAHEFLHAALRHDERCEDRNPALWNIACDYVVNGWLAEMQIGAMPESVLFDPAFRGMSAESLYDLLCADIRLYLGAGEGKSGDIVFGEKEHSGQWSAEELDSFYRSAMQQGLEYHQCSGRGYLPAALIEEIYAMSRPPIRWDVELAKWFDENFSIIEKHRTYSRMSRRQSSTPDIPRPAWRQADEPTVHHMFSVLLDTSSSMDRHLLAAALGSIASYSEARDVRHIRLVFCDAAPYDQGIVSPDELAEAVQVKGRGGTVLQPGIDLLDHDPKFPKDAPLLIITDGQCDRLNLRGRNHAFLVPYGNRLPFPPRGPVFRLK